MIKPHSKPTGQTQRDLVFFDFLPFIGFEPPRSPSNGWAGNGMRRIRSMASNQHDSPDEVNVAVLTACILRFTRDFPCQARKFHWHGQTSLGTRDGQGNKVSCICLCQVWQKVFDPLKWWFGSEVWFMREFHLPSARKPGVQIQILTTDWGLPPQLFLAETAPY